MNTVNFRCRVAPAVSIALLIAAGAGSVSLPVYAQGVAPPLWTRDSIHSKILGETRLLRIALPVEYDARDLAAERYPVLIVLDADAELSFTAAVANARALGVFGPPAIPRLIIIGVETANRVRDMTPPALKEAFNSDRYGGAPAFLRFLSTELWPHITEHYRALPVVVIAGHSLSGLFAGWAFGQQPELFRGAIALSPSLPLGNGVAAQQALDAVAKRTEPGRLFVAVGTAEGSAMTSAAESFAAALQTRLLPGIAVKYQPIEGASHDQTGLLGVIPALQFVFDPVSLSGYEIPRLLGDDAPTPRLIAAFDSTRERYVRGARQLGMPRRLPLSFLRNQSRGYRDSSLAPLSLRICQELATSYPTFWNGYACTGDAQARMGRGAEAAASYRRASEVARRAGANAVSDSLGRMAGGVGAPRP